MVLDSLVKFFRSEDGVTAAEYAVMLGLIILALISSITSSAPMASFRKPPRSAARST